MRETATTTERETPDVVRGGDSLWTSWVNKDATAVEEPPVADQVMLEDLNVGRILRKRNGNSKMKTKAPTVRKTKAPTTKKPQKTKKPQGSRRGRRVLDQLLESNFAGLDQD